MAEFIELHKKSLMDEKTFAVLQNVNNISEICETPRREALISLRNNPVAGYYDRFETVETYEQIKQLLSECGSIATADVAPVVYGRWIERRAPHAMGGISAKCSACSKSVQYLGNPLNYCPHCGAKMDGGANNG